MESEDFKKIRQQLFEIRVKLNTEGLSEAERKNLENHVKEVRKNYALALIDIKKGEMENEKYQGR